MLRLNIPGIPVSGNVKHGMTADGKLYNTNRAREYSRRIQSIAKAEVAVTGWVMPDYVRVDLELVNINMDRDNVAKTVNDALQGIVYVDDRRILDGAIQRKKNPASASAVTVSVASVCGADYGFPKPRPLAPNARRSLGKRLPAHVAAAIEAAK